MTKEENIQARFFDFIIKRYSKELVLHALMDILYIKKGAAYKRMNGDTALLVTEMVKIAEHFGISLDAAIGNKKFLTFEHPFLKGGNEMDFLDRYSYFLQPLRNLQEKSSFTYMGNEIPVFYYFSHRHIFTFLLAVWKHLHWDEKKLVIKEKTSVDPRLDQLRTDVAKYYASYPVTEIWNNNMLSNLYQQILFCVTIRAFEDRNFIRNLIHDIAALIEHLHELAGSGQKPYVKTSNVKIYLNDFGNYQNLALYTSEKFSSTFIGFDMPHFIVSYSDTFHQFSKEWVEKIKNRSILISSEGFQFRELFFIKLNKDFEDFKNRLEKLISVYYD